MLSVDHIYTSVFLYNLINCFSMMYAMGISQHLIESFAKVILNSFWIFSEYNNSNYFFGWLCTFLTNSMNSTLFFTLSCAPVEGICSLICFRSFSKLTNFEIKCIVVYFYWKNSFYFAEKFLCCIWKMLQKSWCFHALSLTESDDWKCNGTSGSRIY